MSKERDDVIERNGPDYLRGQIDGLQTAFNVMANSLTRGKKPEEAQAWILETLKFSVQTSCEQGSLHFMNGKREMLEALIRQIPEFPRIVP